LWPKQGWEEIDDYPEHPRHSDDAGASAPLLLSPLWLGIGYGGYKLYQSHVESTAPTHFAQYSYAHVMEVRATGGGNHEIDEAVREFGGIIVGRLVRFTAVVGSYKYDVQATVFRPVRPGYYQVEIGSNAIYGEFGLIVGADAQGHPIIDHGVIMGMRRAGWLE
jgi:hypothetical protein